MTTKLPNMTQIRQALNMAFDDSTFSAFCLDYFLAVYDKFSQGMRKDEKITLLLDYCRRRPNGFHRLLQAVRQEYQISHSSREELKPLIRILEADRPHFDHRSTTKTSNVNSSSRPQETVSVEGRHKNLSFTERAEMVGHLLAVPSIANRSTRATVVAQLPPEIITNIAYHSVDKTNVFNIVNTCLHYPNGIQELIKILQFFEGKSIPMQQLEQALNRLLRRGFDRNNEPSPTGTKQRTINPESDDDAEDNKDHTIVDGDIIYAQGAQGFINRPTGPVEMVFGEKRTINTSGGSYVEGNVDKRKGSFFEGGTFSGPVMGYNEGGTVTFDYSSTTQPKATVSLQEAYQKVQQAVKQARQNDNDDLADELQGVELDLKAALRAENKGKAKQRQAKLRRAREDLATIAEEQVHLQFLAKMLWQVQ